MKFGISSQQWQQWSEFWNSRWLRTQSFQVGIEKHYIFLANHQTLLKRHALSKLWPLLLETLGEWVYRIDSEKAEVEKAWAESRHHGSLNVPIFHITQPWSVYGQFYGYYFGWCPIFPSHGTVTPTPGHGRHGRESAPVDRCGHSTGTGSSELLRRTSSPG